MSERFGQIQSDFLIPASHAIRRNAGDTDFETFDTSSLGGISIGDAIGNSPDSNGILFVNGSDELTTDSDFTYTGTVFNIDDTNINIDQSSSGQNIFTIDSSSGNPSSHMRFRVSGSDAFKLLATASNAFFDGLGSGTLFFRTNGSGIAFRADGLTSNNAMFIKGSNRRVGIGDNLNSPAARLHVIDTSAQFRVGYDTSNYFKVDIASDGETTFTGNGTGKKFVFADDVEVPDDAYGSGWNGDLSVPTKNAIYDRFGSSLDWSDTQTVTSGGDVSYSAVIFFDSASPISPNILWETSEYPSFIVKNLGAGTVTLTSDNSDTFNGSASNTILTDESRLFVGESATNWESV